MRSITWVNDYLLQWRPRGRISRADQYVKALKCIRPKSPRPTRRSFTTTKSRASKQPVRSFDQINQSLVAALQQRADKQVSNSRIARRGKPRRGGWRMDEAKRLVGIDSRRAYMHLRLQRHESTHAELNRQRRAQRACATAAALSCIRRPKMSLNVYTRDYGGFA